MTGGIRTLPIRLAPLPGEAVDSWLEALAERLHTSIFDLFRSAGIATQWNTAKAHKPWVHHLDTEQLAAVGTATGVPADRLAGMTLDRYAGTGLIVDRPARPGSRPRWWRGLTGSRFCPRCLAENGNRWMLSWRLAWSFACTRHHILLRDTCPACESRHFWIRIQPPDSPYLGELGLALPQNSPHGKAPACTFSLEEADTISLAPDGPVTRAQHHIDAIITALLAARAASADLAPLLQNLDDLHAAARATLAALRTSAAPEPIAAIARSVLAEHGLPDHGHDRATGVAVGATAAHLMLATGPTAPDPAITTWLAHATAGGSKARLSQLLGQWDTASPKLQGALLKRIGPRLNPAIQLRYGTATSTPRRPRSGHGTTRAASLPGLFWRGWALRLNPLGHFDPLSYRQALSLLLQIAGLGDLDYTGARALLGQPPASGAVCAHFTKKLRQSGTWEPVLSALGQLARQLDEHPAPIDYGRRRRWRRISAADLNRVTWQAACTQIRYRSSERQERFARLRLIELLTGNHPYYLPDPLTLSPARDGEDYSAFVFALPAQLSTHLHEQAQGLLRRLHIDEPVIWEPPFDWVEDISWPGPHPDDIQIDELWSLAKAGLTRSAIATRLHTTPDHILLAAARHPQPSTPRHTSEPGKDIPRPVPPGDDDLRGYVNQGLSSGQIAHLTGCSHQLISTRLINSGIGPPVPGEVLRTLNPAWLREQYEDKHRPFTDIAADLGIPPSDLARHARKLGIATRRGVAAHKHVLADHGGPDAFPTTIWTLFNSRGAEQRIRRFLAIPGHPNLNHAAEHLGVRKASLTLQVQQLERALGAILLEAACDSRGMALTPAGETFVQEILPVLDILDQAELTRADHARAATRDPLAPTCDGKRVHGQAGPIAR
ncbi:LysR family transcriptional regulator [Amycolatopsis sp. K13G38]|uniref:LysR family transcriptional regulator n=1 Tax=Amycolatopsis acididurans TaxID=2724524 RepID=A0ABX1JF32_9PSEU|nr:TniQ family protein [Amycolatopsis acididurans]NKQ57335.1 LysR family transcriptional regulator [Amycolatopsis acididurans]